MVNGSIEYNTYMHVFVKIKINFYNIFQISKQARVISKVTRNDHHQIFCCFVINHNTGFGVDIKLKFVLVKHKKRIVLMMLIVGFF